MHATTFLTFADLFIFKAQSLLWFPLTSVKVGAFFCRRCQFIWGVYNSRCRKEAPFKLSTNANVNITYCLSFWMLQVVNSLSNYRPLLHYSMSQLTNLQVFFIHLICLGNNILNEIVTFCEVASQEGAGIECIAMTAKHRDSGINTSYTLRTIAFPKSWTKILKLHRVTSWTLKPRLHAALS